MLIITLCREMPFAAVSIDLSQAFIKGVGPMPASPSTPSTYQPPGAGRDVAE